jgi:hypothetical protein
VLLRGMSKSACDRMAVVGRGQLIKPVIRHEQNSCVAH